jgi:hypothetical protein
LGQTNTVVLCPALTSHSELGADALESAGISATTVRISVGDEDPRYLLRFTVPSNRFIRVARELGGDRRQTFFLCDPRDACVSCPESTQQLM